MKKETGLFLFHSNRLECLVEGLAEKLGSAPLPPLASEIILVQSKGMQKWLSLALADKHGICANCQFPYPNSLIRQFFSCLPDKTELNPCYERGILRFILLDLFPQLLQEPLFEPLHKYLGEGVSTLKSFQLAQRLAYLFDQYATYRPELLLDWEAGTEDGWQSELWRRLVSANKGFHRAVLQRQFLQQARQGAFDEELLPARINVFAVSTLPPFHLDLLMAAGEHCSVNFFLLNPCREYWFDLLSPKRRARLQAQSSAANDVPFAAFHYDEGHPLLTSWGQTGSDFFSRLLAEERLQIEENFSPSPGTGLLPSLQNDILCGQAPSVWREAATAAGDNSLQVHSCHTPLREMEVLQDYLLACFDQMPDLRASDILVMTPDIEKYAPYISAVFDSPEDESRRIPYAIADRKPRDANRLAGFLFALCALRQSRFEASRVVAVLECPQILGRFGLQAQDLDLICHWLDQTRVRWGIDAEDRREKGLPPVHENSWRAGLERLLLGYAYPGNSRELFAGILPYADIEGASAAVFGNFLEFFATLTETVSVLNGRRTFKQWLGWMRQDVLGRFFLADADTRNDFWAIEEALTELERQSDLASCAVVVDFDVVEAALLEELSGSIGAAGQFLSGKVTFCALLPMRSIPFRVIALVGLHDGEFPRHSSALSFDLMARNPRPGDRSLRQEDKYLFLETLISARERLFISYLGQNIRDNSELQPAIVVSELLAYVKSPYQPGNGSASLSAPVFYRHPLQSFDSAYFRKDSPLFSYSRENLLALQAASADRVESTAAVNALPLPEDPGQSIELSRLVNFFQHPVRYFCRQRLGLYFEEGISIPDDRENFQLQGLERFALGNHLTSSFLADEVPARIYPAVRGMGILPHGESGRVAFAKLCREANALANHVRDLITAGKERVLEAEGNLGDYRLYGKVGGIFGDALVRHRFASIKGRDQLSLWLELLFLQTYLGPAAPRRGVLAGSDGVWTCPEPVDPGAVLRDLLAIFLQGMTVPLVFFPESSLKYWLALQKKNTTHETALALARKNWSGNDFSRGESEDPYYDFCFRGGDPLAEDFFSVFAERIYRPMLTAGEGV